MDTKKPWASKTVWLNTVGFLLTALLPFIPQLGNISAWLADPSHLALVGSVWAGLGIFLRFISKDKIQLGD